MAGRHKRVSPWRHVRRLSGAALVGVTAMLLFPFSGGGTAPKADREVRLLAVGDSITQGVDGDHTWRWFLTSTDTSLDEATRSSLHPVGPSNLPVLGKATPWKSGQYADPAFPSAHAAVWGDSFTAPRVEQIERVREFHPEVIVLMLGTNDIRKQGSSAEQTATRAAEWIERARAAAPGVDVVLSEAPITSNPEVMAFNDLLPEVAERLDRSDERVVVAHVARGYDMDSDTWDGVHPNESGQRKIGLAVADALAGMLDI